MALFGDLLNFVGGLVTNSQNRKENQLNRDWSEKMWNLNNVYNSPSAVLQRYSDAGIQVNPNYLVTGSYNGGLSSYAGNLDASRSMENPSKFTDTLGELTAFTNIKNQNRQTKSTIETNETQQALNKANENKSVAEAENLKSQTVGKDLDNLLTASTLQTSIDLAKESLISKRNANKISQIDYQNKMQEFKILEQRVIEAKHNAEKAGEEVNTQKAMTGLVEAQKLTEHFKQQNLSAQTAQSIASAYESYQQANYYNVESWKTLQLTPSEAAHLEASIDKIHSETKVNYETATKIAVEYEIAKEKNQRENYKTYVVEKYGSNMWTILTNEGTVIGKGIKKNWRAVHGVPLSEKVRNAMDKPKTHMWFKPKSQFKFNKK